MVEESSTSRLCSVIFLIVGTVLVALGILLTNAGGIHSISNSTAPSDASGGPLFPLGLGNSHDIFFNFIFLLTPVVLTWFLLFKSSNYDFILKLIAMIFVVTVVYSLFFQGVAQSVYDANTVIVNGCKPDANNNISVAQQSLCDGLKLSTAGIWITFIGELTILIILAILSTEIGGRSTPTNTVQPRERVESRQSTEAV